jgi:hypothetical protein
MVFTRLRLFTVGVAVAAVAACAFYFIPETSEGKDGDYTFTPIGTWKDHTISIDDNTVMSKIDEDGDTLTGAVFRLSYPKTLTLKNGMHVSKIISSVIGVCGYNGVLVLTSEIYNEHGEVIATSPQSKSFLDQGVAGSLPTEAYAKLCPGAVTKPPKMTSDTLI